MPSSEVMHKFKHGTLKMGRTGKTVPRNRPDIARAILMSEKRNEAEHGGEYVSGGQSHTNPLEGTRRPRRRKEK